ncbi:enoyl-CoA hydratase/isomerase family protein [Papillibacter cinnamivorans]|uniref:short-chain-enoyl-CoA hydratase n=1 Tax=Papillibacter cinnamivorans DSM 12816 TaxID=1122930 RepID=A0A1W1ZL54_9FIRM|nr:enoyl-CoA hydratase-related protein [Papillibacter cinnamivorans]SMC49146.1 enoyl-CoA hydratase [Papillibacter cinnamivorans DSM 12816]
MNGLLYEKRGNVGIIRFNRPKVLNAVDTETAGEFSRLLDEIEADREVRCAVLTGEGRAFCAGGDIDEESGKGVQAAFEFAVTGDRLMEKMERLRVPIIAAINGYCLGGGLEFAMACDIRLAADSAVLGSPEVSLGTYPGWGGTQRLPRIVGASRAKELMMTCEKISAQEALRIGLADRVVRAEELMDEALKLAGTIAGRPPIAVSAVKISVNEGMQCDITRGIRLEANLFAQLYATEDLREAYTAYLEKRPPKPFTGR